jgi:hypothetical protein
MEINMFNTSVVLHQESIQCPLDRRLSGTGLDTVANGGILFLVDNRPRFLHTKAYSLY